VLSVKAKLAAIDAGISSIEREFLADIVTNDGRTVMERMVPVLAGQREFAIGAGADDG
jgi:hypothetical protein